MFKRIVSVTPSASIGAVVTPRLTPALSNIPSYTQTAFRALPAQQRAYHEKDINPRNVGSFRQTDDDVGTGLVGAPACGDVMKLQIRVDKDTNVIHEAKFKTFGCGSAIASSSYLTELVRGMTLEEASKIRNTVIAKELCLPPVKLHCSMLAEDAIKSAISNYYTKHPDAKTTDLGHAGCAAKVPEEKAAADSPAASL